MNNFVVKTAGISVLMLALAACSSVDTRSVTAPEAVAVVSAEAAAAEQARQEQLLSQPQWQFQGRAAISKGRDGGNGRLDWQQNGPQYRVELSAPVTRQSWVLTGDAGQARLEGLAGGPRLGADAALLLREATGWDIPVALLMDWVRGLPAQGQSPEQFSQDARGRPRALQQAGWTIHYLDWYEPQGTVSALPKRIEASSGDAKVRLIIDQWGAGQE
jgi:outer membrane lipoprotein LolB